MVVMERNDAVAAERDDPDVSADRRLVPLEIKVTFAFTNAPQAQYLMHYTTIDAWSDGSDTLAGIKQKFFFFSWTKSIASAHPGPARHERAGSTWARSPSRPASPRPRR